MPAKKKSAPKKKMKKSVWYVYFARCADASLYCGITPALKERFITHNAGKGAKYTRSRLPVVLVYSEKVKDYSTALKREYAFKQLTKVQKEKLCGRSRRGSRTARIRTSISR